MASLIIISWRDIPAQVIVKLGAEGCLVSCALGTRLVPAAAVAAVIDTTAAGDAFNAGFLAARRAGQDAVQAAGAANRLAALVIQHRGAILPRERSEQIRAVLKT